MKEDLLITISVGEIFVGSRLKMREDGLEGLEFIITCVIIYSSSQPITDAELYSVV